MSVYSFYKGKNIFITGGTGFIGKVLIEKLLRTFPDLGTIYVLIRSRKGKTPQERLNIVTENVLFDKLKENDPDAFKKLKAIEGDVSKPKLGISDEDWKFLTNNVNIFFHTAASVRFDDPLTYAIKINVRSTRDLIQLALETKNVAMFIHVSTTYCNTDKRVVEEKIYPPHGNWRDAIKLAEEGDQGTVDAFALKYISPLRNTYTYAKSLAEHVVVDMCKGKIRALIIRPSVVISTYREPLRGWNDNFNGPVGLLIAGGKGLLRICYGNRDSIQDYIPVDGCASLLIYSAYKEAREGNLNEIEVYNNSKYRSNLVATGDIIKMGGNLIWDVPFNQVLWYPRFSMTSCWYNYYFQVILFHMIPAFFLDILLRIAGQKPMLFSIQRKIYIANTVLYYFIQHTWDFVNTKSMNLQDNLHGQEKADFAFESAMNMSNPEVYEYFRDSKVGIARGMFKEDLLANQERNRKKIWRLYILDFVLRSILLTFTLWFLFFKSNCFNFLYGKVENYMNNL